MESYLIQGCRRLDGAVQIHGAKNSVLPILAACVCCAGVCEIRNCPRIKDVETSIAILRHLGCRVDQQGSTVMVDASRITCCDVPAALMCNMRSSVLFLGALLMRCGEADLVAPGGCALGERPIDLHLWAMEQLGAGCIVCGERMICRAERLQGCSLPFRCSSVGATENALLAALGCVGETVIYNAAQEPEIVDLVRFLRASGAKIAGEGTTEIVVEGGKPLHGVIFTVMPDRIETATYLCAVAGCGGDVLLRSTENNSLRAILAVLQKTGCKILEEENGLRICASGRLQAPGCVITEPYPGFPTDAQAPVMACVLRAAGSTGFTETVFENRLRHVEQMQKLHADICAYGRRAVVRGVKILHGADLQATDLRCGAALVVAALQAEGVSTISGVAYINRGYEDLVGNFRGIGAEISLQQQKTFDTNETLAVGAQPPWRRT